MIDNYPVWNHETKQFVPIKQYHRPYQYFVPDDDPIPTPGKVIEIREGVWEIVDSEGYSVFASHCQMLHCGQPTFSKKIVRTFVCRDCAVVLHKMQMADANKKRRSLGV